MTETAQADSESSDEDFQSNIELPSHSRFPQSGRLAVGVCLWIALFAGTFWGRGKAVHLVEEFEVQASLLDELVLHPWFPLVLMLPGLAGALIFLSKPNSRKWAWIWLLLPLPFGALVAIFYLRPWFQMISDLS